MLLRDRRQVPVDARRGAEHRPSVDACSYPPARHRRDFDSTRRCIKHQGQCCCIVENVAIPCDSEIPMYRGGVLREAFDRLSQR